MLVKKYYFCFEGTVSYRIRRVVPEKSTGVIVPLFIPSSVKHIFLLHTNWFLLDELPKNVTVFHKRKKILLLIVNGKRYFVTSECGARHGVATDRCGLSFIMLELMGIGRYMNTEIRNVFFLKLNQVIFKLISIVVLAFLSLNFQFSILFFRMMIRILVRFIN